MRPGTLAAGCRVSVEIPDSPECDELMAWFSDRVPPDVSRPSIVHGDFKLDNVVLDSDNPTHIVGILDWEMATTGDPLADLAYILIYWPSYGERHAEEMLPTMPHILI